MGGRESSPDEVVVHPATTLQELTRHIQDVNRILRDKESFYLSFQLHNRSYFDSIQPVAFPRSIPRIQIACFRIPHAVVSSMPESPPLGELIRKFTFSSFYVVYRRVLHESLVHVQSVSTVKARSLGGNLSAGDLGSPVAGRGDLELCPICFEKVVDVSLNCTHAFCEGCIRLWRSQEKGDHSCPLCRAENLDDLESTAFAIEDAPDVREVAEMIFTFIRDFRPMTTN